MANRKRQKRKAPGTSPGSLVYTGEIKADRPRIHVIDYNRTTVREFDAESPEQCFAFASKSSVTWINVDGLHDVTIIEKLGKQYGLHPLVMEDIVNPTQRPKVDDYDDHLYIVLRMLHFSPEKGELTSEQISIVLGRNYVLTFQEQIGDMFDPIRERIRKGGPRIRTMQADYLAQALIDAIVDHYLLLLEQFGDILEELDEAVLTDSSPEVLQRVYRWRQQIIHLRKTVLPARELLNTLIRDDSKLIDDKTLFYLRDVYDHILRVQETTENYRESIANMIEAYRSTISIRMNEIMQMLTLIATIFIPLTFIVGIYGMNFQYMPELEWKWGYPAVLLLMTAITVWMIIFFRRKHWI